MRSVSALYCKKNSVTVLLTHEISLTYAALIFISLIPLMMIIILQPIQKQYDIDVLFYGP
ncbi:MAG: hypothetical protein ACMUEM_02460 [Flavobacteriales bacterium AspAUS03]